MSNETIQQQVRGNFKIFIGVLALTLVAVGITLVSDAPPIPLILGIAAAQASLVAVYLMHLGSESKSIQWLFAFSAFFVVMLFLLMVGALSDPIEGTESVEAPVTAEEAGAGEEH